MSGSSDAVEVSEVRDVHPVFRSYPFLVESGATLVRGESFLSEDTLKRIDLQLRDSKDKPLFAEVEWNTIHRHQVTEYRKLIEAQVGDYRLVWVIPDDLLPATKDFDKLGVEVKTFSREKILEMITIRRQASALLLEIKRLLEQPLDVVMYNEKIRFEDPIRACYFEGRAKTDKGLKKVGMKQPAVGRYLDLIRCVVVSSFAHTYPELNVEFIRELLAAPYCYKPTKFWVVVKGGFAGAERTAHLPKSLIEILSEIWALTDKFHKENGEKMRCLLNNDPRNYDLILRILDETIASDASATSVGVKHLLEKFIDRFPLLPLQPTSKIWHSTLNQWIQNMVKTSGYEYDLARRIVEIAVLKRMLIPVRGVTVMWVLAPRFTENKLVVDRVPCQSFTYNRNVKLHLEISRFGQVQ